MFLSISASEFSAADKLMDHRPRRRTGIKKTELQEDYDIGLDSNEAPDTPSSPPSLRFRQVLRFQFFKSVLYFRCWTFYVLCIQSRDIHIIFSSMPTWYLRGKRCGLYCKQKIGYAGFATHLKSFENQAKVLDAFNSMVLVNPQD